MSSFERCPRCGGNVLADRRTQDNSCLQCGYEYIESTPLGQNPSFWEKRVALPVHGSSVPATETRIQ